MTPEQVIIAVGVIGAIVILAVAVIVQVGRPRW